MTKQSGMGDNFYVDEFNLSGDIAAVQRIRSPRAALLMTGIDKSAPERKHGHKDGELGFTSFFNDETGSAHPVLKTRPAADRIVSYFRGTTIGKPAASLVSKQIGYDPVRGEDGSLKLSVAALGNAYGLEWGHMLTAGRRTDSAATNGSSLDYGAAVGTTTFGLQMYVHLFAFTGTSVTIAVQSSTDNGGGDAFAAVAGATTAALTAVGKVRIATAVDASVERYLRVVTTGTFSNAVFAVNVVRNEETPVF